MTRNGLKAFVAALGCAGLIVACGPFAGLMRASTIARIADDPPQEGDKTEKQDQSKQNAPVITVEGERVNADEATIYVQSTMLEEGEAFKKLAKDEANVNNVRYNINGYHIGYSLLTEKKNDYTVFTGPIKAWRATAIGEVSRWPPVLYSASRKETMRQAKLVEPIPPADPLDESKNLRVYFRPLLVNHDGKDYVEQPSALAFFVHPKTATRMTILFRDGRSYASVKDPLVVNTRVFLKEVVPGRGKEAKTLVPSIFYSKEVKIESEPLPKGDEIDRIMQAVIAARGKQLPTDDFKALFEQMSSHTGGKTEPVAASTAPQSAQRK